MEPGALAKILRDLESLTLPPREVLLDIISQAKTVLQEEPNVIRLQGNTNVVGDVHGHFFDFLNMMSLADQSFNILFLGDYVDRGYNSVELFIHLMVMKVASRDKVFLLRGNHENRAQTAAYGFRSECVLKYDHVVYWKICEVFELLPVAAIVNGEYFCVHGGISPDLSCEWLESLDRVEEYAEISCILWGDPCDDIDYFKPSQRGAGFLYGRLAVGEFLRRVGCSYLVRSHQLVFNGAEKHFDGKCITIWSSPNYCYKCRNRASFMVIEDGTHDFVYFDAVKEQFRTQSVPDPLNM